MKKKTSNKKSITEFMRRQEWSRVVTFIVSTVCGLYAIWSGWKYYQLCELAILRNSTMPDATLPVTGITGLLGSILGYLTYQGVLKHSLNKHNLKIEDGIVRSIKDDNIDEIIEKVKCSIVNDND